MNHQNDPVGSKRTRLLYREVNKRIRAVNDFFQMDGSARFVCECGEDNCATMLALSPLLFDEVADDGNHLVASHHKESVNGRLVAEHEGFLVVTR